LPLCCHDEPAWIHIAVTRGALATLKQTLVKQENMAYREALTLHWPPLCTQLPQLAAPLRSVRYHSERNGLHLLALGSLGPHKSIASLLLRAEDCQLCIVISQRPRSAKDIRNTKRVPQARCGNLTFSCLRSIDYLTRQKQESDTIQPRASQPCSSKLLDQRPSFTLQYLGPQGLYLRTARQTTKKTIRS